MPTRLVIRFARVYSPTSMLSSTMITCDCTSSSKENQSITELRTGEDWEIEDVGEAGSFFEVKK